MWKIASTVPAALARKSTSSSGATRRATACLAMLRRFSSSAASRSQTTISRPPRAVSAATRFEPMKPAPPVTTIMAKTYTKDQW